MLPITPHLCPQPVWNQHAMCSFTTCAFSPLNCLNPLLLFRFFHSFTLSLTLSLLHSFTPSLTTPSAFHYPIPVRTKLTAEGVQDAGAIWVTSPLQIYLARSVFRRERNLNPAKREPAPGSLNCPRRRNSKQRGTL